MKARHLLAGFFVAPSQALRRKEPLCTQSMQAVPFAAQCAGKSQATSKVQNPFRIAPYGTLGMNF
jgi:hypothetical protein